MDERLAEAWKRFRSAPNEADFATVYEATHRLVWTICVRVLAEEADARDAFQATYTRLLAERPATDDPVGLVGRLAGLEADALRKRRARLARREVASVEGPEIGSVEGAAASRLEAEQLRTLLLRETARLEDDLRVPVQLHFLDGLSQREVASATGVSVYTVSTRIQRALDRLRPLLRRAGIERVEDALPALLPLAMLLVPPADLKAADVFATAVRLQPGFTPSALRSPAAVTAGAAAGTVVLWKAALTLLACAFLVVPYLVLSGSGRPTPHAAAPSMPAAVAAVAEVPAPAAPKAMAPSRKAALPPTEATPLGVTRRAGVLRNEVTRDPVPDTTIRIFRAGVQWTQRRLPPIVPPVASVTTTAEGRFELSGLAPGAYLAFVDSPDYLIIDDDSRNFRQFELLRGADQPELEIIAWPGYIVSGHAFDSAGSPLAGVRIRGGSGYQVLLPTHFWKIDSRPWYAHETHTADDGSYTIKAFGSGFTEFSGGDPAGISGYSVSVSACKEGYIALPPPLGRNSARSLKADKSRPAMTYDFRLAPAVLCHLVVTDPDGKPVPDTSVEILDPLHGGLGSGADGVLPSEPSHFCLPIPADAATQLRIRAPGFVDALQTITLAAPNAADPLRVELRPDGGTVLRLRFVDQFGEPVRTEYVAIKSLAGHSLGGMYTNPTGSSDRVPEDEILAGGARLVFDGSLRYEPFERPLTAADIGIESTVVFTRRPAARHLAGTILGDDGSPLAGAEVFPFVSRCSTDQRGPFRAVTDDRGRYAIDVPAATQILAVTHPALGVSAIRQLRDGAPNDLDWRTANALAEVRALDPEGKPYTEFFVSAAEEWAQNVVRDPKRPGVFFVEQGIHAEGFRFKISYAAEERHCHVGLAPGQSFVVVDIPADGSAYRYPTPGSGFDPFAAAATGNPFTPNTEDPFQGPVAPSKDPFADGGPNSFPSPSGPSLEVPADPPGDPFAAPGTAASDLYRP